MSLSHSCILTGQSNNALVLRTKAMECICEGPRDTAKFFSFLGRHYCHSEFIVPDVKAPAALLGPWDARS